MTTRGSSSCESGKVTEAIPKGGVGCLGCSSEHDSWRAPGDNAHMESFFHSLKADLLHGTRFLTESELRSQLRCYLWYDNYQRLHSALGYRSPVDYERRAA
jgi:transposase InsO family protein